MSRPLLSMIHPNRPILLPFLLPHTRAGDSPLLPKKLPVFLFILIGALGALSQGLMGVANGAYGLDALTRPMTMAGDTVDAALHNEPAAQELSRHGVCPDRDPVAASTDIRGADVIGVVMRQDNGLEADARSLLCVQHVKEPLLLLGIGCAGVEQIGRVAPDQEGIRVRAWR